MSGLALSSLKNAFYTVISCSLNDARITERVQKGQTMTTATSRRARLNAIFLDVNQLTNE